MSAHAKWRVLLVEDEAMIAMLMEDMLLDLDCEVVETASRIDGALAAAENVSCDLAFLDLNLSGSLSYPVASALKARGIPFAFVTGYGAGGIDPAHATAPVLQKPFQQADLSAVVQHLIS